MKTATFGEKIARSWLTCDYKGKQIAYAHPPVRGTHTECFNAINADAEIVPAGGLDIALLTQGAFTGSTQTWQGVKDACFVKGYVRAPKRLLWMPSEIDGKENELAGFLVETDFKGEGLSTKMNAPDISGWKQQNGVYVNPTGQGVFVPRGSYKLGGHDKNSFVKDGLAIAILTPEGAEIFAKTAYDNNRAPWTWGVDITQIASPEQRVSALDAVYGGCGLDVNGSSRGDYRGGYAFGVKKGAEGAEQKI